jgi:hypothetical protein
MNNSVNGRYRFYILVLVTVLYGSYAWKRKVEDKFRIMAAELRSMRWR